MVDELLAAGGIVVTYEAVRQWGRNSARRSPIGSASALPPGRQMASGRSRYLGRGRTTLALARCRPEWLRSRGLDTAPKRLACCGAAHQEALEIAGTPARDDHGQTPFVRRCQGKTGFHIEHRQHKALNNGAKNSHQPTRRRERIMKCFNRLVRLSGFCQFTIRSRTFSTSRIPEPSLPTSVVLRASEPLRLGARSARQALSPILDPLRSAFFGSAPD